MKLPARFSRTASTRSLMSMRSPASSRRLGKNPASWAASARSSRLIPSGRNARRCPGRRSRSISIPCRSPIIGSAPRFAGPPSTLRLPPSMLNCVGVSTASGSNRMPCPRTKSIRLGPNSWLSVRRRPVRARSMITSWPALTPCFTSSCSGKTFSKSTG